MRENLRQAELAELAIGVLLETGRQHGWQPGLYTVNSGYIFEHLKEGEKISPIIGLMASWRWTEKYYLFDQLRLSDNGDIQFEFNRKIQDILDGDVDATLAVIRNAVATNKEDPHLIAIVAGASVLTGLLFLIIDVADGFSVGFSVVSIVEETVLLVIVPSIMLFRHRIRRFVKFKKT